MNVATAKSVPKSAAPGPYLGFSLQQLRLTYHLLRTPSGNSVSLEYLDDVAVHRADGSALLEQCKSALSGNPVSDRADAFWNTFGNWADRCTEGLDPDTTDFVLFVSPTKAGDLVRQLAAANSPADAQSALVKIKSLLKKMGPSHGASPHIARFLAAGDCVCETIIQRFSAVFHDDPVEIIRQALRPVLPEETLDSFCAAAIGMARDMADELIRKSQIPMIEAGPFRTRFRAFIRKYDLSGLLLSKSPVPTGDVIQALVDTEPLFVRQLVAVEASHDLLVTAVSDFLRSEADKVDWADEGSIINESLEELDQQLERQHKLVRDEIEDTMSSDAESKRGRAVYRRCCATKLNLEGRELPSHFIPGAFNSLADCRRLGWHPNYETLFSGD
jgi:hypothetical protein